MIQSRSSGKERDSETGLDWFSPGRYYTSDQARFTSTDPLNIPGLQTLKPERFRVVISDPQNWNQYTYAHSSPINKIDPDGYLTIIIPGTWNDNKEWSQSEFRKLVEKTFGETAVVLNNDSMGNSKDARSEAAKQLVEIIRNHKFKDGETLNIVAHSHGGNVAFEATKTIDRRIDNLVTLGTPIRTDYRPNFSKVANFLNVFSRNDNVQTLGGRVWVGGSADRQIRSARVQNLDATSTANGHSDLWTNSATWRSVVKPRIKK